MIRNCVATFAKAPRALSTSARLWQLSTGPKGPTEDSGPSEEPKEDIDISTPWYLQQSIRAPLEQSRVPLPPISAHAPKHTTALADLALNEYGMADMAVFDMLQLPEDHEFRTNNPAVQQILVCTGKSEKHIQKAAQELKLHLKHNYESPALIEGLVSSSKTPAMRRRLLRKARKGPSATDNDYGKAANSWVLVHMAGVDLHFMTDARRTELNLELLWCLPEDAHLYERQPVQHHDSDSIFSGIRRYHTVAKFSGGKLANTGISRIAARRLHSLVRVVEFLEALAEAPDAQVPDHLAQVLAPAATITEALNKFLILRHVHQARPDLVSFDQVEAALLEKYTLPLPENTAQMRLEDVVEYAKLLLDSPSLARSAKADTDTLLDRLATFISVVYRMSSDELSLTAHPELASLLWRLSYIDTAQPVTPAAVDQYMAQGPPRSPRDPAPTVELAANNARNVVALTEWATRDEPCQNPGLAELRLFTYGNAGKWTQAWALWDELNFSLVESTEARLDRWARLVVYVALRANKAQALHFLNHYWLLGSLLTFKEVLLANDGFSSEQQRQAVKTAMGEILALFEAEQNAVEAVQRDVDLF